MARVKIIFPDRQPLFQCQLPVRITDINYGNHLGNDALLSIIHEARMQLLSSWGFTELDAGGNNLIMGDVMIAYKKEAHYGDVLKVSIWAEEITDKNFDLLYKVMLSSGESPTEVAHAKTGMVCFDYTVRKIASMKMPLKTKLKGGEN